MRQNQLPKKRLLLPQEIILIRTSFHAHYPRASFIPALQSHTFSRSYGANLPTSLTYILPKTRGFSPLKPAADICTTWLENYSLPLIFMISRKGWEIDSEK